MRPFPSLESDFPGSMHFATFHNGNEKETLSKRPKASWNSSTWALQKQFLFPKCAKRLESKSINDIYIYILLYITWEAICSQKNMLMETQPQPQWERWTCWIGQPWKNMLHHSRVGRISIWELHHGQIAESDGCFCWFKGRLLLSDLNKRNTWAWVYTKSSIPTNSLAPSVQVERLIAEITHIHNHIFIEDPPMSDGGACWSAGLSCV